jgi:hypothetical protein
MHDIQEMVLKYAFDVFVYRIDAADYCSHRMALNISLRR